MSIKSILKKEGIDIVKRLDTLTLNTIAKNIANTLSSSFPALNLDAKELFIKISRLNMYFAHLPNGISAKYFYKNNSIYFDCNLDLNNLPDVVLHECIHYLQEKRDKNGNISKLGLCDYTDGKLPGIGLNEAAVQLMASKALDLPIDTVKYFDIEFQTNTPTYYPLECVLVNQMAYVIGEDVLFDSTINANNNFKDEYISLTSEKDFLNIQKNIDLLIEAQNDLGTLCSTLDNNGISEAFAQKVSHQISLKKLKVKEIFIQTQKLILTSYFDNTINLAFTSRTLENYRNKLYLFKNVIATTENDNFYNTYYIDKMMEIEKRYDYNWTEVTDLVPIKTNFIYKLIAKIKLLFGLNQASKAIYNKASK